MSIESRLQVLERRAERDKASAALRQKADVLPFIAPIYHAMHQDVINGNHSVYCLPGGRGSGKSSCVALEIVDGVMMDETGETSAIVFRRWAATLRDSVYNQCLWAIEQLGAIHLWRGNISPMRLVYLPTGAEILFRGCDDTSKLKSLKPSHGRFRLCWFEEFTELDGMPSYRNIMQSVARGGDGFQTFITYNPPISVTSWANQYELEPDERRMTVRTTYKDLPQEWLGYEFIAEAERLREINPRAYKHEYLGEAVGSGGQVFENIELRQITDEELDGLEILQGVDFGFSVDPAAFVRIAYDRKHDTLLFVDEIYGCGLRNSDLAERIKAKGYHITEYMRAVCHVDNTVTYGHPSQLIIADAAEPKSIADLRYFGLKVVGCTKGAGSVMRGIKWLQCRRLVFDSRRTPTALQEFTQYEYKKTKSGEFLADVPDKDNHLIDAVRYACEPLMRKKGITS